MKKEINNDSVLWVRGVRSGNREFGIAFVDGALCRATVISNKGVEAAPVSIKDAAAVMRGFPDLEGELLLDVRTSDEGWRLWCDELSASSAPSAVITRN